MSSSQLPERASLEYLKKLAKDRLQELRRLDAGAQLATALLAVARDHGFFSWRALKAEIEQRQNNNTALFFEACAKGDVDALRSALARDPGLVRAGRPDAPHNRWTGLHEAAKHGHAQAVEWLLEHGADPNAREAGDNTYPLHWAAAHGHLAIVRALLDAGGDVHGMGDAHQLDVIGWATFYHAPRDDSRQMDDTGQALVSLLVDRGARHHIFSAMSVGDLDLVRRVVDDNPDTLDRRMSRFEQGQTPLHFAMNRHRYDILDLLIGLGADLEAEDRNGQTALAAAMLRGDREAMRHLHAAGARQPPEWEHDRNRRREKPTDQSSFRAAMATMADSIKKGVAMISVPDVGRALEWYASIGFRELARYEDQGVVNFGMVSFGRAELMLNAGGTSGRQPVSFWFYTDNIEALHRLVKSRQIEAAQAALAGDPDSQEGVEIIQDLYEPFYGGREFGIRDPNGYTLNFLQPADVNDLRFAHERTGH